MALTYDVLKTRIKSEGKLTLEELFWIVDRMESIEKKLDSVGADLDERVRKFEREKDDHIPGGI